ncbi:metal ABC transporter substrate-binding protein [uncultured Treponema sp.]|uniref:metal ABC transporter substrate-binding protein n=1 Tax=uncultured Treponema sp. TaxID=162155 RepID=UPI0025FDB659|nr:metal ABC transporter substrate-binding protein [uncultured Treponema sp.]
MKKLFLICVNILLIFNFTSCREKAAAVQEASPNSAKFTVLSTIFPSYDWAKNLVAGSDSFAVDLLLKDGVDMHSYQPSAADIVKISTADIFIYVGGESDAWISDALKNATNKDMIVINLMEVLKGFVKQEEIIEGMQGEDSSEEDEEEEFDEHVWLSLNNAIAASNQIARSLMEKDESNSSIYMANLVSYMQKLISLKNEYSSAFGEKTIIVCDRFPFRYLADEFGIKYYAAFPGCSAETEASFDTIAFLAGKIDELEANSVFVTESADKKIARTVVSSSHHTHSKIITLDSMQSTTLKQAKKGADYIEIMRANLEALK